MPSQHKHRAITPRPPQDVREAATDAAARQGVTLNGVVVEFLRWFGGLTDKLPERPERRPRALARSCWCRQAEGPGHLVKPVGEFREQPHALRAPRHPLRQFVRCLTDYRGRVSDAP